MNINDNGTTKAINDLTDAQLEALKQDAQYVIDKRIRLNWNGHANDAMATIETTTKNYQMGLIDGEEFLLQVKAITHTALRQAKEQAIK